MMNIKDIAKLAGVSASTVSKIINNKDQTISKETRERVLKNRSRLQLHTLLSKSRHK